MRAALFFIRCLAACRYRLLRFPARTALVCASREFDMDDDGPDGAPDQTPDQTLGKALRLGAIAAVAAVATAAVVIAAGRALLF